MIPFPTFRSTPSPSRRGLRIAPLLAALPITGSALPAHAQAVAAMPSLFDTISGGAWWCIGGGAVGALVLSVLLSCAQGRRAPGYLRNRIQTLIWKVSMLELQQINAENVSRVDIMIAAARKAETDSANGRWSEANLQIDLVEAEFLRMSAEMEERRARCLRSLEELEAGMATLRIQNALGDEALRKGIADTRRIAQEIRNFLSLRRVDEAEIALDGLRCRMERLDPSCISVSAPWTIEVLEVTNSPRKRQLKFKSKDGTLCASWLVDGKWDPPTREAAYEREFPENGVYRIEAALNTAPSVVAALCYISVFHPVPPQKARAKQEAELILSGLLSGSIAFILLLLFHADYPNVSVHRVILTFFLSLGACFITHAVLAAHRRIVLW